MNSKITRKDFAVGTTTAVINDDARLLVLERYLKRMPVPEAIQSDGKDIYNRLGGRVAEHATSDGRLLAIKLIPIPRGLPAEAELCKSEASMMQWAARHGVLAPAVHGVYDIVPWNEAMVAAMVSDRVTGVSLDKVWHRLSHVEQHDVKIQLRYHLWRMRQCTLPFIGRPDYQPTRNLYDRIGETWCGPWEDEESFDDWCLERLYTGCMGFRRKVIVKWLEIDRQMRPTKFVLTHGDLTPRNIMIHNGKITGIVDWERSGFFPEYAEYAFAMCLGHQIEKWWKPVLKEILQPCPPNRLRLTRLIENRGW